MMRRIHEHYLQSPIRRRAARRHPLHFTLVFDLHASAPFAALGALLTRSLAALARRRAPLGLFGRPLVFRLL